MLPGMPKYSAQRIAEIRDHLERLDHGDVSVADYAAQIGVAPWTIYTWKRRFGDAARPGSSEPKRGAAAARADLLEVHGLAPAADVEIQLGDVVVRVPRGSDPATVQAAVRAVKSC